MVTLLLTLFIIICVLLIILVLLQKGRGGGLGAAFGGLGTSAFGTKTGDVLTWATIVLTGLFLLLAVVTALAIRPTPTAAATPGFDPLPTEITEPVKVRIVSATAGAKIYYTLDNTIPDDKANPYTRDPVTVEPGQTLMAIAYGPNRTVAPSPVASGYYGPQAATAPAGAELMTLPVDVPAAPQAPAMPEMPTTAPAVP